MGKNWAWNWRLTVLKTIKMTPFRAPHDQFQGDGQSWLCCFCMWPPPSAYKTSCPMIVRAGGSQPLDRRLPSPHPVANIQNKANFPFHQPCLFIGFWAVSRQTPLSVTLTYVRGQNGYLVGTSCLCNVLRGQKIIQNLCHGRQLLLLSPNTVHCSLHYSNPLLCRTAPPRAMWFQFQRWQHYPVCPTKVLVWNFPFPCWKLH